MTVLSDDRRIFHPLQFHKVNLRLKTKLRSAYLLRGALPKTKTEFKKCHKKKFLNIGFPTSFHSSSFVFERLVFAISLVMTRKNKCYSNNLRFTTKSCKPSDLVDSIFAGLGLAGSIFGASIVVSALAACSAFVALTVSIFTGFSV